MAATGLPKLYAPAVKGLVGGRVRFTARLSSSLPWTVTVTNSLGRIVARHTGVSADVDWTWDSTPVALAIPIAEPLRWTIDAGGAVLPASGSLGQKALPAVVPSPRPAKPPPVVPVPALTAGQAAGRRALATAGQAAAGRARTAAGQAAGRDHPQEDAGTDARTPPRPPPRRRPPRPPTC